MKVWTVLLRSSVFENALDNLVFNLVFRTFEITKLRKCVLFAKNKPSFRAILLEGVIEL